MKTNSVKKQQLFIIHLVVLLTYIGLALPYSIYPLLFIKDPSSSQLLLYSLIISIYPLGQAIGMVFFGYLSDFYGRKIVLQQTLFYSTITFIGSGICISTQHYILLVILRFFCGLFEGNVAIALAAINDLYKHPTEKTKWFGRVNIVLTAGFILGPFLGSIFSNKSLCDWFDFSTPFFVAGLLSIITFLSVYFFFKDTSICKPQKPLVGSVTGALVASLGNLFYFIKKPGMNSLLILSLCIAMSIDILYQFVPVYFVSHWHATSEQLAMAVTALCAGKILGNGWFLTFFNTSFKSLYKGIIFSITLLIICLINLLYSNSIAWYLFDLFLIGICIALTITNSMSAISTYTSIYQQGRVISVAQSLRMFLGAIICNVAMLSCKISFVMPFILSIIIAFVTLLGIVRTKRVYSSIHKKTERQLSVAP